VKIQATRGFNDSANELSRGPGMSAEVDLAVALFGKGDYELALQKFDAVLNAQPKHLGAQLGRNFALLERVRHQHGSHDPETLQQALNNFECLARDQPKCWQAHVGHGEALALSGRLDEALASLRNAVELEPNNRTTRGSYADLLVFVSEHADTNILNKRAHLDEAIEQYDFALDAAPGHQGTLMKKLFALVDRAKAATAGRDYRAALDDYNESLRINPDHLEARRGQYLMLIALDEPRSRDFCGSLA